MFKLEYGGRATDYAPELLQTHGKAGRLANAAKDALWEAIQGIAERDVGAWVKAFVSGEESPKEPGVGRFIFTLEVLGSESAFLEAPGDS